MSLALLRRVDGGDHAETMREQNDGLVGGIDRLGDPLRPVGEVGLFPIRLLDAARARKLRFPAALPMIGPGIAETGNDENVGVLRAHGIWAAKKRNSKMGSCAARIKGGANQPATVSDARADENCAISFS